MKTPHARRIPVPAAQPLIARDSYDYADAYEIRLRESDTRSVEEFARRALEQAPWPIRWTIRIAHRYVLRVRLGPRSSPGYLSGWKIVMSERDVIQLEAVSPLLGRAVIVARRPEPTNAVVATYLFYARPAVANLLWTVVGPLHRRVAPYLLEHAAGSAHRTEDKAVVRG